MVFNDCSKCHGLGKVLKAPPVSIFAIRESFGPHPKVFGTEGAEWISCEECEEQSWQLPERWYLVIVLVGILLFFGLWGS